MLDADSEKHVRRHFSLTHYFPWMAETFNLSENDSFTMLSGIAHDPIQRDVFTPLFLGARLLVPAKEEIRHERLAEWMRKYEATVTHLTPAMGQILVGGASAEFPSLRNAFFVGDQLIKRDCRLLQALAPNCRIINMFGIPVFSLPIFVEITLKSDSFRDDRNAKSSQLLRITSSERGLRVPRSDARCYPSWQRYE